MNNISYSIEKLGFDKWFQDHVDPESLEGLEIARVIGVHKDSYKINPKHGRSLSTTMGTIQTLSFGMQDLWLLIR